MSDKTDQPATPSFLSEHKKTHDCGALRASDVGATVVLCGWVDTRRDHGGCVFVDLRDREGITQVVFDPRDDVAAHAASGDLRSEFCIGVVGRVVSRGDNTNAKIATGEVEVRATKLEIFSRAVTPPFEIVDDLSTNEALRLEYRYLDLRRPVMQRNLLIRSRASQSVRRYLSDNGFAEVETPFMVKYTPGGARNFVVPSRLHPGSFYALAESPQIYKQLLMVSGFERYFQIVRCFRDEDPRLDRQLEFTQVDIEMSFVDEDALFAVMEGLVAQVWKDAIGVDIPTPIRRMTYAQAMADYGTDKPDLRLDLTLCDVTEAATGSGFRVFDGVIAKGGVVKCLRVPDGDRLSRTWLDGLTPFAKQFGVKGIAFARIADGGAWKAPFAKNFTDAARDAVNAVAGAQTGDVLLFCADTDKTANTCMGAVRTHVGAKLDMIRTDEWAFMWLTDPPLFEKDDDGGWVSCHHPFTSPRVEDEPYVVSDPGRVLARGYDLVLNGFELGGGSIRIHRSDLQAQIFQTLGISDEEAQQKFGFLLQAFQYGPPPHGGIAFGLDRIAMLLCGGGSLRDVLAFPKSQKGTDLLTGAPTPIARDQMAELFLQHSPDLPERDG